MAPLDDGDPRVGTQELLTMLRARWPREHGARASLEQTAAFVHDRPDALSRNNPAGHVTASGVIIAPDGDSVLLVLHRRLRLWLQTGGHCEPGESPRQAARREAVEESGIAAVDLLPEPIDVDVHEVACRDFATTVHYDIRFAAVVSGTPAGAVSAESRAVRWFPVDGLPAGLPAGTARAVAAASALVKYRSAADGAERPSEPCGSR